jgi:ribonuclease T1
MFSARSVATLLTALLLPLLMAPGPLPVEARQRGMAEVTVEDLPAQARQTLALIRRGGPFPYRKDGTIFGNRERRLPPKPRGYYTEYTVPTPSSPDRGARRIIAGGDPARSDEMYYSEDHYASFRKIRTDPRQ